MVRKAKGLIFALLMIALLTYAQNQWAGNPTHDCLDTANEIETVIGHFEEKFSPTTASGKAFDARQAVFLNYQVKWGMITVEGSRSDTGMCWVGGYVHTNKPWDASWDDHKDLEGPTRNSAAISNASTGMTVTRLHYFNIHDGMRTSSAFNWVAEHNWGEYVRDDCIENDHLHSGRVYDSLFDGCYTGISTRPSSSDTDSGWGRRARRARQCPFALTGDAVSLQLGDEKRRH
jgi:hypothetical protein